MRYIVTLDQSYFSGFYTYEGQKYAAWNDERTGVYPKYWKTRKGAEKAMAAIVMSNGDHEGRESEMEVKEVGMRTYHAIVDLWCQTSVVVEAHNKKEAQRLIEEWLKDADSNVDRGGLFFGILEGRVQPELIDTGDRAGQKIFYAEEEE